ncbi:MAG: type III polyketide synthase [Anaerolineae bacterium]|jgi:alkylresorcinol/alkylpyrone synthase
MTDVQIVSLATANPPLRLSQEQSFQIYEAMVPMSEKAISLLQRVFVANQSIGYRHFGMDSPADVTQQSQDALIARYQKYGVRVAVEAARKALDEAGLAPEEVDGVVVNSCTGYLCPGLTSYVAEALPLRPDVWPFDLQGMGCGGALPNLQTAYNYLQTHPDSHVLVIAVEICSATLYLDEAPDVLISNALFGDGAAAAVVTNRPDAFTVDAPVRLKSFAAGLYPRDRHLLYYRTENSKLRNVLSIDVPEVGAQRAGEVVERLLDGARIGYEDVDHWIIHPGGQKVLDAFRDALDLPDEVLAPSRAVLYHYGNMSSATVLFVLKEVLRNHDPRPGDRGVLSSFGAGFGAYAGLVEFV